MTSRVLKLRRPDVCVGCGTSLEGGEEAGWTLSPRRSPAWHVSSGTRHWRRSIPLSWIGGHAGGSAGREYDRRKTNRETRVRNAHPHVGGLLLWLTDAPQHEVAFKTGEFGEIGVAESLERRTAEGPAVILPDRRMPQGRGNIDHVAIAPTGVFVIDAKAHSGNVRIDSPLFGSAKLRIAGRDSTKLIDGLDRQVAAVSDALARAGHPDVTVQGVLCFTAADLPLLRTLKMRGHLLLYPQAARQAA